MHLKWEKRSPEGVQAVPATPRNIERVTGTLNVMDASRFARQDPEVLLPGKNMHVNDP